jgi:hypothetical protein
MDRPREIVWFETLGLIAWLFNIVSALSFRLFLVATIVGAVLGGGLILWIARGRSPIGRIILTAWYGLALALLLAGGAIMLSGDYGPGLPFSQLGVSLVVTALNGASLIFVWSKPSTQWLKTGSRTR